MGALYEDVEMFFGAIFAWYGRLISSRPFIFMLPPVIVCSLLSLGLLNVKFEYHLTDLHTPLDGQVYREQAHLKNTFAGSHDGDYFPEQLIGEGQYMSVILSTGPHDVTYSADHGVVKNDVIVDLNSAQEVIKWVSTNISVEKNNKTLKYNDLCAKRDMHCYVHTRESATSGMGDLAANESIKVTFYLGNNSLAEAWLDQAVTELKNYRVENVTLSYTTSRSLDAILHKQVMKIAFF